MLSNPNRDAQFGPVSLSQHEPRRSSPWQASTGQNRAMNRTRLLLLTYLLAASLGKAQPSFKGVMVNGSEVLLAIQLETGSPSNWSKIGEHVGPYLVESFNAKSDTVTLRTVNSTIVLRLPDSKTRSLVDIEVIESLASSGHERLALLVRAFHEIKKQREKLKTALARFEVELSDEKSREKVARLRATVAEIDSGLGKIFDRMQSEASKATHR